MIKAVLGAFIDRYRVYLYAAAAIAIAAAVAAATIWIMHLRDRAATADTLERREAMLAADMMCGAGEDVLACHRRHQREIAEAQAKALDEQARVNADEQNRLAAQRDKLAADLARIDAEADADQDAGEPLPAAIGRYYDRERQRRGIR